MSGGDAFGCGAQLGGAFAVGYNSSGSVSDSTLEECSAQGYGGALNAMVGSTLAAARSAFSGCEAGVDGGAVMGWHSWLSFVDSNATGCISSTGCGGAISAEFSDTQISGAVIRDCNAIEYGGGALCIWHSAATLSDSVLAGCAAYSGGAASVEGGLPDDHCSGETWCRTASLTARRVRFTDNSAVSDTGGAISATVNAAIDVADCAFEGNAALVRGGAIDFFGGGKARTNQLTKP